MSAADANAEDAFELLRAGDTDRSTVLALLAIRWELRTANLLAVARLQSLPVLDDGWGSTAAHDYPDAAAIRDEIRRELDLDGEADR